MFKSLEIPTNDNGPLPPQHDGGDLVEFEGVVYRWRSHYVRKPEDDYSVVMESYEK